MYLTSKSMANNSLKILTHIYYNKNFIGSCLDLKYL